MAKWNPFNPAIKFDPYEHYAAQIQKTPVFESKTGFIYVLDYENVRHILLKPEVFIQPNPIPPEHLGLTHISKLIKYFLLFNNGEKHKIYRRKAITAFIFESIEEYIRAKTEEFLVPLRQKKEFDLIIDFAGPLYSTIFCKILGFPESDAGLVEKWGTDLFILHDFFHKSHSLRKADESAAELHEYILYKIKDSRNLDPSSFLGQIRQKSNKTGRLSDDEIEMNISLVSFLVSVGIETVTSGLGNSVYQLISQPDKYKFLKDNLNLLPLAVEELLRFDPPVQFVLRVLKSDYLLNGVKYSAGRYVVLGLGAANRDVNQFDYPNELVLNRRENHNLAFGLGRHHCLGANLARINLRLSLDALLTAFPSLSLTDEKPVLKPVNMLKGFQSLKLVHS